MWHWKCKRLIRARRELCVIPEKGKEDVACSTRFHFLKKLGNSEIYNICYNVCKNISAGCLTAVSDSLAMHNKAIVHIYMYFSIEKLMQLSKVSD